MLALLWRFFMVQMLASFLQVAPSRVEFNPSEISASLPSACQKVELPAALTKSGRVYGIMTCSRLLASPAIRISLTLQRQEAFTAERQPLHVACVERRSWSREVAEFFGHGDGAPFEQTR